MGLYLSFWAESFGHLMGQLLASAQFSARMGEEAAVPSDLGSRRRGGGGGGALGVETIRDEREGLRREATGSFPAVRWVTRWACDATCSVGFSRVSALPPDRGDTGRVGGGAKRNRRGTSRGPWAGDAWTEEAGSGAAAVAVRQRVQSSTPKCAKARPMPN